MNIPVDGYPDNFPPDLYVRAEKIKLVCFDVDGTLTDGQLYFDYEGRESKAFHAIDGLGIALLRKSGFHVAFITARTSQVALNRARELGVEGYDGVHDKLACVDALCQRLGISRAEVAFMGDDLPDLPVLRVVGLAVIPANAHTIVRKYAHYQSDLNGGQGAARQLCDLILLAQQKYHPLIKAQLGK